MAIWKKKIIFVLLTATLVFFFLPTPIHAALTCSGKVTYYTNKCMSIDGRNVGYCNLVGKACGNEADEAICQKFPFRESPCAFCGVGGGCISDDECYGQITSITYSSWDNGCVQSGGGGPTPPPSSGRACWCTGQSQCPGGYTWGPDTGNCAAGLKCCDGTGTPNPPGPWCVPDNNPECNCGDEWAKDRAATGCKAFGGCGSVACTPGVRCCAGLVPGTGACICPVNDLCNPKCGQVNQYGGLCPDTDNTCSRCGGKNLCTGADCPNLDGGTPTAPTIPGSFNVNQTDPLAAASVLLRWNPESKADFYEVQMYPTGAAIVGDACPSSYLTPTTPATFFCTANQPATDPTQRTYAVQSGAAASNFTWRVRAINQKCSATVAGPWAYGSVKITGRVAGQFILDEAKAAGVVGGLCTLAGVNTPVDPGAGTSVQAQTGSPRYGVAGSVSGSSYRVDGVEYGLGGGGVGSGVALTPPAGKWQCSCPVGCSYFGLTAPKAGVNFFLTSVTGPWWQSQNGLLFAGAAAGQGIFSGISDKCVAPACTPALSLRDAAGIAQSAGFAMTGGSSIDSTADSATQYQYLSQDGRQDRVVGTTLSSTAKENYAYFNSILQMGTAPQSDFNNSTPRKPNGQPNNGRAFYAGQSITITATPPWTVSANDEIIIMVNGDLTIQAPITVANGGFLAFIVKGNIIIDPSVGQTVHTSTTPVVEGVYIADGQIQIKSQAPADDKKFVGAGTFVGWGGVVSGRTYANAKEHFTTPTDLFIFRPDLVANTPPQMMKNKYEWFETN